MSANTKWVQTWGQSHSALSLFYYPSCKKTYRLVINSAVSGEAVRIKLSNSYGKQDVKVGKVTVGLCNEFGTVYSEFKDVTFNGSRSFVIKKGERLQSDAVDLNVKTGYHFCISMYIEKGDMTSGNLLDNVLLITSPGDKTNVKDVPNERRTRDSVIDKAGVLLGMHLPKPIPLFDSAELLNSEGASAIVVFGDSVSQQGFWTNPFEKRIREAYPGKYSLINKSVMGNRLLFDCSPIFVARGLYGKKATTRIKDDVYPYDNISHVILFLGVNDVFEYGSINAPKKEKPDTKEMCKTIKEFTDELHKKGCKVISFNIPGFGTAPDATREKDGLRREVNNWLSENQGIFDGFFDIATAGADPNDDYCSRAEFIGPDKLHPNAKGGKFFADLIDISWFE